MTQPQRWITFVSVALVAGAIAACDQVTAPVAPSRAGIVPNPGIQAAKRDGTDCKLKFTVTFTDGSGRLRSDGGGAYVDGVDKVVAFTGSGSGFRLDTNGGSQKLEGAGTVRRLRIDLTGVPDAPFQDALKGIDLRFFLGDGGLDLCSLGATGEVGLTVAFEVLGATNNQMTLTYGVPASPGGPPSGYKVVVTRTGAESWRIEGEKADLRDGALYGTAVASNVDMPFTMTLERK